MSTICKSLHRIASNLFISILTNSAFNQQPFAKAHHKLIECWRSKEMINYKHLTSQLFSLYTFPLNHCFCERKNCNAYCLPLDVGRILLGLKRMWIKAGHNFTGFKEDTEISLV